VAGSCEHGNEPSGSVKRGELINAYKISVRKPEGKRLLRTLSVYLYGRIIFK
jgi:hypothetical protein